MAFANPFPSSHCSIISDEITLLYHHEFVAILLSSLEEFPVQTIPYPNDIVTIPRAIFILHR
jgi:hypothetical protein